MKTKLLAVLLLLVLLCTAFLTACDGHDLLKESKEPSNDEQTQDNKNNNNDTPKTPVRSVKTGISLPSATQAGTYSYSPTTATDMSTNDRIGSQAAALIDVTNGRAVATKNGSTKIYPASMTKVMTVLVACENAKDPTELLTVTADMVEKYKSLDGPSTAHTWQAGYQVTVEDALYMAIYKSDTYACWLLAEHVANFVLVHPSAAAFWFIICTKAASLPATCSANNQHA